MLTTPLQSRRWPLGLVSNCWKIQLEAGDELSTLISQAEEIGLSVIELRQTCLGTYEDGPDFMPNATRLANLAKRFPGVQFNIALSLPCFGGELRADHPMMIAGRNAAVALAGSRTPHLRLVDLQTSLEQFTFSTIDRAASGLANLMPAMKEVGGILSIEHARQPWSWFCSVMTAARSRIGQDAKRLQLCFDPCNLLLTEPVDQVSRIVDTVDLSTLSMIHLKQRLGGLIQPELAAGDLGWTELIGLLASRNYQGPILFEVAAHSNVWSHLKAAIDRFFSKGFLQNW